MIQSSRSRAGTLFLVDTAQVAHAFGIDRAGIHTAHTHAVAHAFSAQTDREVDERRIVRAATDVAGVRQDAADTYHIDDDATPAPAHLRVDDPGDPDVAEQLEVPGRSPGILVDLVERAARNGPRAVDQNVDMRAFARKGVARVAIGQVHRMSLNAYSEAGGDVCRGPFQIAAASRRKMEVDSFAREFLLRLQGRCPCCRPL